MVNGRHSYGSFKLRMLSRSVGSPPKDDHTERVPFSNVTYDFDSIFGKPSYGERTLKYRFEFIDTKLETSEDTLINILDWLHWSGRLNLYDDMLPNYHFKAREPTVDWSENHGVYTFDMTFKADPAIVPNPNKMKYNEGNIVIPDVNGDGLVDSSDSSLIFSAYSDISVGKDPGLTDKQKLAADANMDGYIDSSDASMIMTFYTNFSTGSYKGMTAAQAWAAYLTEYFNAKGEVF